MADVELAVLPAADAEQESEDVRLLALVKLRDVLVGSHGCLRVRKEAAETRARRREKKHIDQLSSPATPSGRTLGERRGMTVSTGTPCRHPQSQGEWVLPVWHKEKREKNCGRASRLGRASTVTRSKVFQIASLLCYNVAIINSHQRLSPRVAPIARVMLLE